VYIANFSVLVELPNMLTLCVVTLILCTPLVPVSPRQRKSIIIWAHEQAHALVMRLFGAASIYFDWQDGTPNVSSDHLFTRSQFVIITLAPLVLLAPFAAASLGGAPASAMLLLMLTHLGTMSIDIITLLYTFTLPTDALIVDDGTSIRWRRVQAALIE